VTIQDSVRRRRQHVGILPYHYTASQRSEDGGSKVLRNIAILTHRYTVSQPEKGGTMLLRNVGILLHPYTASQPRRPRLDSTREITWITI